MMRSQESQSTIVMYIVLGIVLGLVCVGLASIIWIVSEGLPFTLNSLFNIQLMPLFWLIDTVPLVMAVLFGLAGNMQAKLSHYRRQLDRMHRKYNADLQQINDRMSKQEQEYKQLETIISKGKQQWEATFDSVVDMLILTDEKGVIIRCNRATSDAFQTGFRQLIGRPLNDLLPGIPGSREEPGPIQKVEMKFPRLEGWYEVSSDPLIFEGENLGKIYILRNITDRKEAVLDLQRQKQYYELLVRNSPIAIATLNLEDRIVACNPAFESLFGFIQKDAIGQKLDNLISSPELRGEANTLTDSVKKGETIHKITRRMRQDGSLIDVEVFGIPVILWGKQVGTLAIYHDVSELVVTQQVPQEGVHIEEHITTQESGIPPFVEGSLGGETAAVTGLISAVVSTEPQESTQAEEVKETSEPLETGPSPAETTEEPGVPEKPRSRIRRSKK